MLKKRIRDLMFYLLEQVDYELGESTRLFIMKRVFLRKQSGWIEEKDIDMKMKENNERIHTVTEELLTLITR